MQKKDTKDDDRKFDSKLKMIEEKEHIMLKDDNFFEEQKCEINNIIEQIDKTSDFEEKVDFDKKILPDINFVRTKKALERLNTLYNYLMIKVPVLLEGPTGTAKTLSSEIVCKALKYKVIRFNLSSETRTQDLIGRYVGDENSWSGISMKDGPFYDAFKNGKVLILDEINLASESVLQCIEDALDSEKLCIELPGKPLEEVPMNDGFRLIATHNPNKGLYANKRQNLGLKFYSRFQVINFPAFTNDELLEIAKGLSKKFKYDDIKVIEELVAFHQKWCCYVEKRNDPQCFTVREITATVNSISSKKNVYDTIMTIYGARYRDKMKKKLEKELSSFPNLIKDKNKSNDIDLTSIFPDCFPNDSLKSAVKSILFSLKNGRHVILAGDDGCGKTQIALWASQYFNKDQESPNDETQTFFCVCTDEIKVSDLIGHQVPSSTTDDINKIIEWQDGFLLSAIKADKCAVMDSIEEAPSTVKERLNSLLDQKYDPGKKYFDIPESSNNEPIEIKQNFRIIATCNFDKLTQMSPAFLNRFDIIFIENQINDSTDFNSLVSSLLNRYYNESQVSQKLNIEKKESDDENCSLKIDDDSDEDSEESLQRNIEHNIHSKEIISKIIEKIINERSFSYISKFCKAFITFRILFQQDIDIDDEQIVDFVDILLKNKSEVPFPKLIKEKIYDMLKKDISSNNEPFYYEEMDSISTLLIKLMAYSLIRQPIGITGETGVGKTSLARVFSLKKIGEIQMHSFHSGTKASHIFGTTIISNGKIKFQYGSLANALKKGSVFIADEFNLATQSAMKSLALALDPTIPRNIYIPNLNEFINISPEFQFIACQNEIETKGRNIIPQSIAKHLIFLKYPDPDENEIKKICLKIAKEICTKKNLRFQESDGRLAQQIGIYMNKLKYLNSPFISKWSFRDITKIFKRIYNIKENLDLIDIEPLHIILFYTMSSVPPSESKNVIQTIKGIFQTSFDIVNVDAVLDVFTAKPKIKKDLKRKKIFIFKKNCGVAIDGRKIDTKVKLPSLYNVYFQIKLSDESEHILLIGNSGFKTYLAKLFLSDAQIIYLNPESNVPQLLGKTCIIASHEANNELNDDNTKELNDKKNKRENEEKNEINYKAKLFYIDNILKILNHDAEKIQFHEKLKLQTLKKENVENLIKSEKYPRTFDYALKNLTAKMFERNVNNDSFLSNMILEFRPGLFFDILLRKKTLILKDISSLQTMVFERFNELFSGRQNLTLSEDITNTFTDENKKELTDFNYMFRVFATCSLNAKDKLSEAVCSRFSTIYVPEYTRKELEKVLKCYSQKNDYFDQKAIPDLLTFAESFNIDNMTFSFPQILKTIEITTKMNKITSIENQPQNIGIAIYRILGGLLNSHKLKNALFTKIKNSLFDIPDIYKNKEKRPLKIIGQGLSSNMSNLSLVCSSVQKSTMKVAFTSQFNDLLDLIHMGLVTHNPIILDGHPGQGKHTAINYIASMLDIEIIEIMISQSTKVEDLFGKEIITSNYNNINVENVETQLVKAIKSTNNIGKKQLIILENINNASLAVLDALIPVFNTNISEVLLPNGKTIVKGIFDIIAIFNSQNLSSVKEKLPISLVNSSIYNIVPKLYKKEIEYIIKTNFSQAGLKDEADNFSNIYNQANKALMDDGNITDLFSLNDMNKYIILRKLTKHCFHKTTVMKMIFAYKYSNEKMLQKMLSSLNLDKMKFNPIFNYDASKNYLNVRISKESNDILSMPISEANEESLYEVTNLTLPQKHCLIFLMCSLLAKRTSIIKGETASGKSYLIRLFARIAGKKLVIFQMNSDNNISMLAQQSVLSNDISNIDLNNLALAFEYLSNIKELDLKDIHKQYDINDSSKCNPKTLKELIVSLKDKLPLIKSENKLKNANTAINIIKNIMNPIHLFDQKNSTFVEALKNGDWVLLDGIESAPPATREKIASLCDENPKLNLYEYGTKYYFSCNADSKDNKISDNFHLFITYNQNSSKDSHINQEFLAKGFTFSLPPIDENIEYSSQMLFGLFEKQYPINLAKEMACRLANMHSYAKSISQEKTEDFAGGIMYNGRTLSFMKKKFKSNNISNIEIAKQICFSLKYFYYNSYIKQNQDESFCINCFNAFKQAPEKSLVDQLFESDINNYMNYQNIKKRNISILIQLRDLQFQSIANQECTLSFHQFFENCSLIRFYDLAYIENHVNDTLKIISSTSKSNKLSAIYAIQLRFAQILSYEIPNEYTILNINARELKSNLSISLDLLKIDLLKELNKNQLFSEETSKILINNLYIQLISMISDVTSSISKKSIIKLFKHINENPNHISIIDEIFPYQKFKNSELQMITTWLPITKDLIEKKYHFIFTIDDEQFEFNESSPFDFLFKLVFNGKDNFLCGIESEIHYSKKIKPFKLKNESETEETYKIDFIFSYIITQIITNSNQSVSKERISKYFKQGYKKYDSNETLNIKKWLELKQLFPNSECPTICLIWNILYTLKEKDVNKLIAIIDPMESKFLKGAFEMFQSLNEEIINNIIIWSKWASNYDKYSFTLANLYLKNNDENNFSLNYIEKKISNVEQTIIYFNNSPISMRNYCSFDEIIQQCKEKYDDLIIIRNRNTLTEEQNKIQREVEKLKSQIRHVNINKKSTSELKEKILNNLSSISKEYLTKTKYDYYKQIVNEFLKVSVYEDEQIGETCIKWPYETYFYADTNANFENKDLLESLIWYSKIKAILNELKENKNIISNLSKLGDFKEMAYIRDFILKNIFDSKNQEVLITIDNMKKAFNVLNSQMMYKLINIDKKLIEDQNLIWNIMNDYINRNPRSESEIKWISEQIHNNSLDFKIIMPEFEPNSFVLLVVNQNDTIGYHFDLLFKEIDDNTFLQNVSDLLNDDFKTFCDVAKKIATIAYNLILQNYEAPRDYDMLKNIFLNHAKINDSNYVLISKINLLFDLAEVLDKTTQKQLIFDDIGFLTTNLFENNDFAKKYPSLFFWICKNASCANQLKENYYNYKPVPNEIPLWLLYLRAISSIQCIKFEPQFNTIISKVINESTTSTIINYIKDPMNDNQIISFDWINILISHPPNQLTNNNIRIIHDFLVELSQDTTYENKNDIISIFVLHIIEETVNEITLSIILNQSVNLINDDFSQDNISQNFLFHPWKYVAQKIEQKIISIKQSYSKDKSIINLFNFIRRNDFQIIQSNIIAAIEEDENIIKQNFEDKTNKEKNSLKNKIISKIKSYDEIIRKLQNREIKYDKIDKKVNELIEIQNYFKEEYPGIFSEDNSLIITEIKYTFSNLDIYVTHITRRKSKIKNKKLSSEKVHFLILNDYIECQNNPGVSYTTNNKLFNFIKSEFIEDSDRIDIFLPKSNNYGQPMNLIYFGDDKPKEFIINEIDHFKNLINEFDEKFLNILESDRELLIDFFNFVEEVSISLSIIEENLHVKFTDNCNPNNTSNAFQIYLKNYLENFRIIFDKVKQLINEKIHPLWIAIHSRQFDKIKNQSDYDLVDPNQNCGLLEIPNLYTEIKKQQSYNSLKSPIICLSCENEIICSVSQLKYKISSIFPDYSKNEPYQLFIISLIDTEIKVKIENIDEQNKRYIMLVNNKLKNKDPIKFLIFPPELTNNKPETLVLEGNLIIEATDIQACSIPFEITLEIFPLAIKIKCKQFMLKKDENKKYLNLCCEKIETEKIIDFSFENYYVKDQKNIYNVEFESLNENIAKKPEIKSKNSKGFSLTIPHVEKPTRCQFDIIVKFTQTFESRIHCDFLILPFDFTFKMYDYTTQKYVSRSCNIFYSKGKSLFLYCRIRKNSCLQKIGKIRKEIPYFITTEGDTIIPEQFSIKENKNERYFDFQFAMNFDNDINLSKIQFCRIKLTIEDITKNIDLHFINHEDFYPYSNECSIVNNKFISSFPTYIYDENKPEKWVKIKNDDELNNSRDKLCPQLLVTPFSFHLINKNKQSGFIDYNGEYARVLDPDDSLFVKYIQITITNDLDHLAIESIEPKISKHTVNRTEFKYYSIFGKIEYNDSWFPVFKYFPNINGIDYLPYNTDKKNLDKAKSNIDRMINSLRNENQQINTNLDNERQTSFIVFLKLLQSNEIVTGFPTIFSKFPRSLQSNEKILQIKNDIQHFIDRKKHKMYTIISHNLIVAFTDIFQQKYNELESHLFNVTMPITKDEINKKIYDIYFSELTSYDQAKEDMENENEYPNYINPLPEELNDNEFYVVTENSIQKINNEEEEEEEEYTHNDSNNNQIADVNYQNIAYSIRELPSIMVPNKLNINELSQYYSSCSYGASVFPVYMTYCLQNNIEENDSNNYFIKLLNAYINVSKDHKQNKSILSDPINKFIGSFKSCVNRLKNAGVNFDDKIKILKTIPSNYNNFIYDFILTPKIETPYIPKLKWRIKGEMDDIVQEAHYKNQFINSFKYHVEEVPDISIQNSFPELLNVNNKNSNSKPKIHKTNSEDYDDDDKSSEILPFLFDDLEYENQEENEISNNNDKKTTKRRVISAIKTENLSTQKFEKVTNTIDMKDNTIKLILNKMRSIDKESQIEFSESKFIPIQNHNEKINFDHNQLPIKNLIENSQYLIEKLIAAISNSKCPLLKMSCYLLIDCSCNICEYNKMFNFMILTAFAHALHALEIPFSISIVADKNIRFIMKSFDEELSDTILQQILDCLFIVRYRVNIPDTFYRAINDFECPNRNQKALFIFTDGLDENLSLTNSWKEMILNNINNSFGMIFMNNNYSNNKMFKKIVEMWDNFIEITKKSVSITKLIYIEPSFNDEVVDSIVKLFVSVLLRPDDQTLENTINEVASIKPIFEYNRSNLSVEEFLLIQKNMDNPLNISGKMFIKNDTKITLNGINFGKINHSIYSNKMLKINSTGVDQSIKKEFDLFIHNILHKNRNLNKQYLETIFIPNKASQIVNSSDGTEIDISALILNLVMREPNPPIYLVEKGGLVRNYGISIIIDSSQSCFNAFCSAHAYQTIKALFASLSTIDISCVDIIIATDDVPVVLYREIPSQRLFSDKSAFWPTLFCYLSKNTPKTCKLENAIHAAYDLIATRYNNFTSFIFVLTDGLYQEDQKKLIKNHVITCIQDDIATIGIGIGIYPKGINDIFPRAIFSPNPKHLLKGISSFFGGEPCEFNNEISESIISNRIDQNIVHDMLNSIIQNETKPIFKMLKNDLQNQPIGMDVISHTYNKETKNNYSNNHFIDNSNKNGLMYPENIFEGLKILIFMPYDCRMNIKDKNVYKEKLLNQGSNQNNLESALGYYGIKIKIVQDYEKAIKQLTKQTRPGKCDYYAVWVCSGLPYDCPLANEGNQKYVNIFIDCLIQFWEKGGSVVLLSDGYPFTFQANLFLQKITFPDGIKTKIQFKGNHKGGEILEPDESGALEQPQKFNKSHKIFGDFERASLSHGLSRIPEGKTISYVEVCMNDFKPFTPFIKDSEGGISALFYPGDRDLNDLRGDIIADGGGLSKLFLSRNYKEAMRYFQNIAAWTVQYKSKFILQKTNNPKLFCPDAIYTQINEDDLLNNLKKTPSHLRLQMHYTVDYKSRLFAINTSRFVSGVDVYFNTVKSQLDQYYNSTDDVIMTWGRNAKIITKDQMDEIIKKKNDRNRDDIFSKLFKKEADLSVIPQAIIKNRNIFYDENNQFKFDHLILISDGNVDTSSFEQANRIINENRINFKYVTALLVGENGDRHMVEPLCRNCGIIFRVKDYGFPKFEEKIHKSDYSSFNINIDEINDIQKFNNNYDSLFMATKQNALESNGDEILKRKLVDMKERLNESLQISDEGIEIKYKIDILIKMASGKIQNIFDSDKITLIPPADDVNENDDDDDETIDE